MGIRTVIQSKHNFYSNASLLGSSMFSDMLIGNLHMLLDKCAMFSYFYF